jgi:hypothetical protein
MNNIINSIVFFTLIATYYLTYKTNNISEKILLYFSIILQIIFLFLKVFNVKKLNKIFKVIDKLYIIIFIFGIYFIFNKLIILLILFLLLITMLTRFIYGKCLLIDEKTSSFTDFIFYILFFSYLYKLFKIKTCSTTTFAINI